MRRSTKDKRREALGLGLGLETQEVLARVGIFPPMSQTQPRPPGGATCGDVPRGDSGVVFATRGDREEEEPAVPPRPQGPGARGGVVGHPEGRSNPPPKIWESELEPLWMALRPPGVGRLVAVSPPPPAPSPLPSPLPHALGWRWGGHVRWRPQQPPPP